MANGLGGLADLFDDQNVGCFSSISWSGLGYLFDFKVFLV
jgi:hypothetical protein